MKRILGADRYIGSSSSSSLTRTEKNISYDRNGNLTALKRYGNTGLENDLTYTLSGNRMTGLYDGGTNTGNFAYSYDAMGNMTSDGRKGLQISYNILNLPCGVTSATSGSLTYTYLSDGTKVSAANRYRLGGKEEQAFGCLDLGKVDFGARQYDPFSTRWTTIDTMA